MIIYPILSGRSNANADVVIFCCCYVTAMESKKRMTTPLRMPPKIEKWPSVFVIILFIY